MNCETVDTKSSASSGSGSSSKRKPFVKFFVRLLVFLILTSGLFYAWRVMKNENLLEVTRQLENGERSDESDSFGNMNGESDAATRERAEFKSGQPVFIRIFKEERELELWMEGERGFQLFKTYPIAAMSGQLGPKLAEGDRQAPEGFYTVKPEQMNPNSRFHLAFNIGYPNAYDRALGRTGTYIMVHGSNVSTGCFAMTDEKIDEIYALCEAAFHQGQPSLGVHIFPFRMSEIRMAAAKDSAHLAFWQNLKEGYDWFQRDHMPPAVSSAKGKYRFQSASKP